ncbi:LacI family DNA-binding transcriptional regulator [Salinicoccus hispanicus]|uniref:Substrate-binding domain-containing protein n=1 Tax=Salinicoccus hispanicus TaxID=157225 RepID=A0A6N8U613_9STAP|nr:LacI family DNA-binding transcriptional regulator [Salinicoccus hispanicus]MXQ51751.1 substrate-binding domain-containing protein [Salinicoccus hispanicus]
MVTIKDVAKIAGVSPSTVSRVIKDHDGISSTTKKRVRKIMEEIGYAPNIAARNLVTNQANTIGLVIKSGIHEVNLNPFYSEVNLGVSEACRENGFSTLTTSASNDVSLLAEVKELISSRQVDGFILLYSRTDDPIADFLTAAGFPYVVIGKNIFKNCEAAYVDNDNVQAAYAITELLIQKGYSEIVMIVDNDIFAVAKDRIKGFEMAMEASALSENGRVIKCENEDGSIHHMLESLFSTNQPHALLTLDGVLNSRIVSHLYRLGIRIPRDVATATFSDSLLTKLASPPQTTVDIFPQELGREAGKEIIMLIRDPDRLKKNITVPTRIIERQSTHKEEVE